MRHLSFPKISQQQSVFSDLIFFKEMVHGGILHYSKKKKSNTMFFMNILPKFPHFIQQSWMTSECHIIRGGVCGSDKNWYI